MATITNDKLRASMVKFLNRPDVEVEEFLAVVKNALRQVAEEEDDTDAASAADLIEDMIQHSM
jgi:hypothetical protein